MNVVDVKQGSSRSFSAFRTRGPRCPPTFTPGSTKLARCSRIRTGTLTSSTTAAARGHDRPRYLHRYVIDANRDPSGVSLYPGGIPANSFPIPISTASRSGAVAEADGSGHRIPAETVPQPLPCGTGQGDRTRAQSPWPWPSVRLPLHTFARPVFLRASSGCQHWRR